MIALKVIGIIALIIFLICMITIGADVGYENGVLSLSLKCCGVFLQILPKDESKPKKEKKPKKPKRPKKENKKADETAEATENKPKKKLKLDFSLEEIVSLLKKVFKGLGKFTRFKVDRFLLHYVEASADPYDSAALFGKVNAALDALAPVCRKKFACRDVDVYTDIDFYADSRKIDFGLGFSIRLGQIFGAINTIVFGALGILIKHFCRKFFEKIKTRLFGSREANSASAPAES